MHQSTSTERNAMAQVPSNILSELRESTKEVHLRLHENPVSGALIKNDLSLEHYVFVLQAFERFYEMTAAEMATSDKPYTCSPYCDLLRQDLDLLSSSPNPLPECPPMNLERNTDSYFGMMYVLEGSNLGGQVISKNLEKTLGLDRDNGAAFFCGEGKNTPVKWHTFTQLLTLGVSNQSQVVSAAVKTFEHLEHWFLQVSKKENAS